MFVPAVMLPVVVPPIVPALPLVLSVNPVVATTGDAEPVPSCDCTTTVKPGVPAYAGEGVMLVITNCVGGAAVNVCVLEAATGSVPVSVPALKVKFANAVLPIFMVLPKVAPEAISVVIKIYPVLAAAILCSVNDGNTCVPAPRPVVMVESKVAVPALKVEEVEYQHFKLVISEDE